MILWYVRLGMDPRRVVERFLQARKYTNPTTEIPVLNQDTERVVYVLPETLKQEPGKFKRVPPSQLDTKGKPAPKQRPGQPHIPKKPQKPHRPEIPVTRHRPPSTRRSRRSPGCRRRSPSPFPS